jgi:uncharacterized membrane protein (DUF2068 family)
MVAHQPPGTQSPRRWRPRFHWELLICGLRGHLLVGTDAAQLRSQDALFAREDPDGTRWYRCLRCDSWLPLAAAPQPTRDHPPERADIVLPERGRALRDRVVLRLISIDRALHFVLLSLLGIAVLVFAAHRRALHEGFYRILTDLQGGVGGGPVQTSSVGIVHDLDRLFSLQSRTLHLLGAAIIGYGALEGIEAIGLWYRRRWAEYLTLVATAVFLPIEVYELAHHATPLKLLAFVVNVAVVVYLLYAKRLFGLRGGARTEQAEREHDQGWEALQRTAPGAHPPPTPAR